MMHRGPRQDQSLAVAEHQQNRLVHSETSCAAYTCIRGP